SERLGVYLLNSVNPFRLEGQKTIVLELLQQLGWEPPDWIVVPAGNLGNTAAFGKALAEALAWGLIDRAPRLAAVQADGAAPPARPRGRGADGPRAEGSGDGDALSSRTRAAAGPRQPADRDRGASYGGGAGDGRLRPSVRIGRGTPRPTRRRTHPDSDCT